MKQQLFTTDNAVNTECAVNTKCRGRLLAMAAGILSVLILLVTALQFVISAGADRYSEYSDDCRKFMMDYMKESSSYDTLVNKTYMPYRNYVETLGRDTAFQAEMKAWELATLDLKSAAIQVTNSKEYKYHLGILMDILSDTTQNSDFISSLKNMADACHVSTTKAALKFGKEYNNLNMKLNPQDAKKIAAELSDINTISSYMSVAGDISDLIEQSKNLDDLLNKLSQAQVIYDLTVGYADMMQDMYNRCDSDNTALKAALLTMRDLCNQSMSKVDMVALFAGSTVAEEAMKIALGEVQKEIVSAMGLTGTAITLAQSVGKMYANILFGTENIQAAYYELNALYNIENLIRESLANTTDADSFFAAFTLYEHVTYKAADYSTKYEEALYTDNIAGKLFAWVTGKDKQLEEYKKSIENCKGLVKLSFDTLQFSAYNAFIESKYTSDVSGYFTVTDKYTLPSEETITQNDENIELLSLQTCGLPDEDYTLDDDLTILNNLYHSSGTIDLNGHTLTINGDLILESGSINVDGGYLTVNGNYNAYEATTNKDGTITYSDGGYLYMNNAVDKVTVNGDFNTSYDYSDNWHDYLKLGTIEIKSNLNDYYNYSSSSGGLYSRGTKFIFSGVGKQTITATDGYICFKNVDFVDTENREFVINCEISADLCRDTYITGDAVIYNGNLNGYLLNVNGNLTVNNSIDVAGGDIVVEGDLYNYGSISLNGGYLTVNGNYNAYKSTTNKDGTITYSNGGYLYMNNAVDKVTVNGDFNTSYDYSDNWHDYLKLGTIEIKSNLNDYYNYSSSSGGLYSRGTKFIFSGVGKQTITATDGYICFKNVDFVDTENREFVINCEISADLCRDTYITGDAVIYNGNLNGYLLNVNGNLTVNNSIDVAGGDIVVEGDLYNYGSISLNGGYLTVNGNYNAYKSTTNKDGTITYSNGGYLYMNNAVDKVTVNGDFNTCADYYYYHDSCLKLGTIEIKGDLNDYYNTNSKYYGLSSYGTKFIFSGTGRQIITALDVKLVLNTAEFVNKDVQIACSTEIDVDVPVKVHDYSNEWTIDEEADCVNDGSKSHHCTRCKAKKDITSIPATGHKYVETVVEPSYSNRGYTLYECSVCGYSYKDNYEEQLIVPAVTGFASDSQTKSSAVLGWDKVSCADGYAVELYTGGKWNEVFRTSDSSVTSCTVGSLKADSTYSLRIRAFKDTDDGTVYSDYTRLAVKTKLANVAGLKAQGVTATAVKLDWVRNAGATGYIIEQYKGGKWTQIAVTKNNYTLTFTVKGLAECTPYSFRVKAYKNDGGKTNYSDYVTVKASTLLGTVKNAKVTSTTGTWITLGWDRNTGATGYVLEQYKGGRWTEIAVTKNNTTLKFTVKGLRNDTTYSFRIKAYKTVGDTTTYGSYVRIVGTTDIPNVAKFTGSAVSASAVKLDWSKNDKATGYVIEQYKGGKWTTITTTKNNTTLTFTVKGLAKGTTYSFRIKSFRKTGSTTEFSEYTAIKAATRK